MRRSNKFVHITILVIVLIMLVAFWPARTYASIVDFNLRIKPEGFLGQHYHGSCCQSDNLSISGNFPMYQEFTPEIINRAIKIRLEFNAFSVEDYTIYITDVDMNRLGSATTQITSSGWVEFVFDPEVELTTGDPYMIEFTQSTASQLLAYNDPADYLNGDAITGGVEVPAKDYHFELLGLFVEPTPTGGGVPGSGSPTPISTIIKSFENLFSPLNLEEPVPGAEDTTEEPQAITKAVPTSAKISFAVILFICCTGIVLLFFLIVFIGRKEEKKERSEE